MALWDQNAGPFLDAMATCVAAPGDPERDSVLRWLRNDEPKTLAEVALCALWHNKGLLLMRQSGDEEAEHIALGFDAAESAASGATSASAFANAPTNAPVNAPIDAHELDFEQELAKISLDDCAASPPPSSFLCADL